MTEIARSERQITIFYNSESIRAKQVIALAETEGLTLHLVDVLRTPLTGTQIVELADGLGISVSNLVNQEHSSYSTKFEPHELSTDDWVKMIRHNPEIMKQPIALKGNRTILIETPTDILQL